MSSVGASLSVPQSAQIAPNTLPSPDALLARLQTPEDIQGAQRALNLLGAAPALVVDGVAGRRTQRALEQAFGQARSLPSPPERNERARRLQRALAALGYELGADGLAGQRTRSALADVQSQAGLPSTGTLDGPTMLALLDALGPLLAGPLGHLPTQTRIIDPLIAPANVRPGTSRPLSPAVGPTLREGDDTVFSSARPWVAILQARLGLADDGVLGPNTWNAIRLFNEAAGIEPVNQVGPETWVEIDRRFGLRPQWHRTFAPQEVAQRLREAVIERFGSLPFSDRHLIEKMVRGYGAMLSAPEGALIQNPHLFLTDFGLQGLDAQRGFVFNMVTGELVPIGRQRAYRFAVAHGVGSDQMEIDRPEDAPRGPPEGIAEGDGYDFIGDGFTDDAFSNDPDSLKSSLGFHTTFPRSYEFFLPDPEDPTQVAEEYDTSALRMLGHSGEFNDQVLDRRIVIHGARSNRTDRSLLSAGCLMVSFDLLGGDANGNLDDGVDGLLDRLVGGGVVFAFAPNATYQTRSRWLN